MAAAGAVRAPADRGAARHDGGGVPGQPGPRVVAAGMPRTAKVLRVGIMSRALLEELRSTVLDQAGRERLRVVFDATLGELAGCLPEALAAELGRLVPALGGGVASQAELRLALAQLAGWLDGVLLDIQMAVDVQQAATLRELARASRRGVRQDRPGQASPPPSGPYL